MKEDDNLLNGGSVAFLSSILSGFVSPRDANAGGRDRQNLLRPQPQMKEEKKFGKRKHEPTRSRRISRCMTFDLVQEVSAQATLPARWNATRRPRARRDTNKQSREDAA